MKLTPFKIARIKMQLPQEDRDKIEKEQSEGVFSPEISSLLNQWANRLAPKRLSKTKGAFGKKGTNRKEIKRQKRLQIQALIEKMREESEREEPKQEKS